MIVRRIARHSAVREFLLVGISLLFVATASAQGLIDVISGRSLPSTGSQAQGAVFSASGLSSGGGADVSMDSAGTATGSGSAVINQRSFERGASNAPIRPDLNSERDQQGRMQPDASGRIEFQDFVLQATGRDLQILGSDLFRRPPGTFSPLDNIPVTGDYVVGPGDEIVIQAWGQIDVNYSAFVDRSGTISVPKVGVINVSGIKYQDLTAYLKTAFSRNFKNFEMTTSLGRLRSIQVFVVGQAKRPGTYTLSSLSTLVTALFAVGGPSSKGSMRSIQLKRGNKVVADLDLYDLLVMGDKSKDAQLLPGDVIYFPPVGELVAVQGSVNVPAIYELKQNAPLSEVLKWAGGLSTTAQGIKATVERIDDRRVRNVEEFSLDSSGLAKALKSGDLVTIYSIAPRFENAITLRGSVAQSGRFPWRQGLRIKDIIPEREALLSRDFWVKRNQTVGIADNISSILRQQDLVGTRLTIEDLNQKQTESNSTEKTIADSIKRLQIESDAARFADGKQPALAGQLSRLAESVKNDPARLESARLEAHKLINQIRPPQREVNWDYALIERMNRQDLSTSLIPFNLGKAVIDGDPTQNLSLEPGDVITIFSKEDIQVSTTRQTKYIRLEGEFNSSGVYQIQPGETIRQLITRVGGVSQSAYLYGAEFTRESTRIQQQKNLDEALNRLERDIQRFTVTRAQSVTSTEDAGTLATQADAAKVLVARLRQVRPTGRIVLGMADVAQIRDLPDLPLEDGDRFFIPPPPSMVNVFGSVYNENSFIYRPELKLSDYLNQAGGPTKDADKSSVYVLRADGSVISKRQGSYLFSSFDAAHLMPGDSIVVPEELDKTSVMRNLKDISQILYQFGLGAAALKVLKQ